MYWAPHVTVAAVIEHDNRFLMVEETSDGQQVFNQPAGHLERGESLLEAVCREVREETCRRFTPEALVGVYQWHKPGSDDSFLRVCYRGRVSEPLADCALDPDISATHWLSLAELHARAQAAQLRSPLVLRCLEDACAGRAWPLDLLRVEG